MLRLVEKTAQGALLHCPAPSKFETEREAAERAVEWLAAQGRAAHIVDMPEFSTRTERDAWVAAYGGL